MKCLKRNKQSFYYAAYLGKEPLRDETGHLTGEYKIQYDKPVQISGNISPAQGNAQSEIFGIDVKYERVIVIDDLSCPINEYSILFIEVQPFMNEHGDFNNDYVVKAIARSLNSISIAIGRTANDEN